MTGNFSTASAAKRPPLSTEGCSIADTNSLSRLRFSPAVSIAGVSASMLASVAPLVKVTFFASAPTSCATCPRAVSISPRAARPSACTDDAFPVISSARTTAARASSRKGALAFQSK